MVVLHPPGAACWLCPRPVWVCLHRRGTSSFPKLQADKIFSVFCPKSTVCDPGNSPSPTSARLLAATRAAASTGSSQQAEKREGSKATWLPLQRLLGRPRGSRAHSCVKELIPKPAFQNCGLPSGCKRPGRVPPEETMLLAARRSSRLSWKCSSPAITSFLWNAYAS